MESDWSQGYITEVLYTEHFFRELAPAWLNYVAVLNGCQPRDRHIRVERAEQNPPLRIERDVVGAGF